MKGRIIKNIKYVKDNICLICMKGVSINWAPAQVRRIKLLINNQNNSWIKGENVKERKLIFKNGNKYKIIIDINRANTPPSLFGIERKIAYAKRKYHSGWMWMGVTIGLAGIKLSGSPKIYGYWRIIIVKSIM